MFLWRPEKQKNIFFLGRCDKMVPYDDISASFFCFFGPRIQFCRSRPEKRADVEGNNERIIERRVWASGSPSYRYIWRPNYHFSLFSHSTIPEFWPACTIPCHQQSGYHVHDLLSSHGVNAISRAVVRAGAHLPVATPDATTHTSCLLSHGGWLCASRESGLATHKSKKINQKSETWHSDTLLGLYIL